MEEVLVGDTGKTQDEVNRAMVEVHKKTYAIVEKMNDYLKDLTARINLLEARELSRLETEIDDTTTIQ